MADCNYCILNLECPGFNNCPHSKPPIIVKLKKWLDDIYWDIKLDNMPFYPQLVIDKIKQFEEGNNEEI